MVRDLTQEIAETDDFLPFWYRGTRDEFYLLAQGWMMEEGMRRKKKNAQKFVGLKEIT